MQLCKIRYLQRSDSNPSKATVNILSRDVLAENVLVRSVAGASRRLHRVHVVRPPGTRSPPHGADPDVAVLGHVVQHASDGGLALGVVAAGELANDADLVVLAQPGGGGGDPLLADSGGHTLSGGAGSVAVEVLVHLVDEQVVDRVGDVAHVLAVTRGSPGPGSRVRGSLDEDVLAGGAGATNTVDAGLVELCGLGVGGHVVGLVDAVEHHLVVGLEGSGQVGPEGLKVRSGRDDVALVAGVVVGLNHRVLASFGDVVDNGSEVLQVIRVKICGKRGLGHTLGEEWDTEHVHSHVDERLDSRGVREDVVLAVSTGIVRLAKLRTRLGGTKEFQATTGAGAGAAGRSVGIGGGSARRRSGA